MTKRVEIDYDGSTFRVTGWLDVGEAIFAVPQQGRVEILTAGGGIELLLLDRHGQPRAMRVERAG